MLGGGANVLAFFSQFGTSDKDAVGISVIFAVFLAVVGLLIVVVKMIAIAKKSRGIGDVAPWWLWVVAIVLNVLPFVELIVFSVI
jgi:hypothetical protein